MVELVAECDLGVTLGELERFIGAVQRFLASRGLKIPHLHVVYVYCNRVPKGLKRVMPGVYVGEGIVCVRGNVLANVAYEQILAGLIALSLFDTFGAVHTQLLRRLVREALIPVLRDALWSKGGKYC